MQKTFTVSISVLSQRNICAFSTNIAKVESRDQIYLGYAETKAYIWAQPKLAKVESRDQIYLGYAETRAYIWAQPKLAKVESREQIYLCYAETRTSYMSGAQI